MKNTITYDFFENKESQYKQDKNLRCVGSRILTETICLERECPFYKTEEKYIKDLNIETR